MFACEWNLLIFVVVIVVAAAVVFIVVVKRKLKFDRNFRIKTGAKGERDYDLCENSFCGEK